MTTNSNGRKARPPVFISAPLAALVEGIYRADTTIGLLRQTPILLRHAQHCLLQQSCACSGQRRASQCRSRNLTLPMT